VEKAAWRWIAEAHRCVFSTKAENKKAMLSACWHDIDPAAGLFAATGYVAQFRPEVEGAFAYSGECRAGV